jgi:CheY-like chemotaxis protein
MPGQDGYALMRELRRRGVGKLPAVAFSAYTSDDDRKRTLASGFQLHLAKPIAPEEFASAVAEVARRKPK